MLSESEHRSCLEMYIGLKYTPRMELLIQDSINIARDVGYKELADEYTQKFKEEGLLREERVIADSTQLSREYLLFQSSNL